MRARLTRLTGWLIAGTAALTLSGMALPNPLQTGKNANEEAVTFFESKVRPVLFTQCFACHGEKEQKGGLRLDSRAAILKGGKRGAALVPGKPEASLLLQAVNHAGELKMPPTGKISNAEIAALTEWVQQGAVWPAAGKREEGRGKSKNADGKASTLKSGAKWWSFRPVKRPAIPTTKTRNQKPETRNPIDAFILAKLEANGLTLSPEADKRTRIRRVTFDLTGLPPTLEEIEAFLKDKSPDAYEKVVERLLSSSAYGERWGRHWLDVVRYTDSLDSRGLGGEGDIADAYRYRDWVVNALNADMPFDQFILNQIAGDVLPGPVPDDINVPGTIATGLLAVGNWGNGDADKDKILTDIVDDQIDVVGRGFLGLTLACARCHDHKFDPITTEDYYGMAGIFFSTHILPKLTPKGAGETPMRVPLLTKAEKAEREAHAAKLAELEKRLKTERETQYAAFATSLLPETAKYVAATWDYAHRPETEKSLSLEAFAEKRGLHAYALRQWRDTLGMSRYRALTVAEKDILNSPGVFSWRIPTGTPTLAVNTNEDARTLGTFTLPPHSVSVHPSPTNGVAVTWQSPIAGKVRISGKVADGDAACGNGILWAVDYRGETEARELASGEITNGGSQGFAQGKGAENLAAVEVKAGDLVQLVILPNGEYSCDTTTIELKIEEDGGGKRVWDVTRDLLDDPLKANPRPDRYGNAEVWRFEDMANSQRNMKEGAAPQVSAWRKAVAEANQSGDRALIEAAAQEFAKGFTAKEGRHPFLLRGAEDEKVLPSEARESLAKLAAELDTHRKNAPPPMTYANAAQEGGVPESPHAGLHDVKVHLRGRYDTLGALVPRRFPVALAGEKQPLITQGSGRLELAQWIASPSNPLTARVIVNRLWQHHFGAGLVRTPSNFGFLGEKPTHPELLDWLASELVRQGWSLKKMHKLMVTSQTYRQRSDLTPNPSPGRSLRLTGRGEIQSESLPSPPAQRGIRRGVGGEVKGLGIDPENRLLWRMNRKRLEAEALRDNLLSVAGRLDRKMGGVGERDFNAPRRTLYMMTVRSERSGFGPLFDMADSTAPVEKRVVSTVAPQALFVLNHPFALEQAQALTKRLQTEVPQGERERVQRAYLLLYGRPATEKEAGIGTTYLARMRKQFTGEEAETRAWEAYCQVLLCANEFIYVD